LTVPNQLPEAAFDLEEVLRQFNVAFMNAALELRSWQSSGPPADLPYAYHMPKMHVSMRVSLSYSSGKVKGVFRKSQTGTEQELVSTLELDVLAVPREES